MASWGWTWRGLPPLEPGEEEDDEPAYNPYAEQDKTPTERMYDEMNREERLDGLA